MKEKNSSPNEEIIIKKEDNKTNKYDLKSANDDNKIEYNLFNNDNENNEIYNNKNENFPNIENIQSIKNIKQELNYSLIIKSVLNNISNRFKDTNFSEDEYKIYLLLLSSLRDAAIKSLCLKFIFQFNENKDNDSLLKYILSKLYNYYENKKEINLNSFIYVLKEYSHFLFKKSKYFYIYYFLKTAKNLAKKINANKELESINFFYSDVLDRISKYVKSKYDLFKNKNKINEKKLNDINKILGEILIQNNNNIIKENNINNNEKNIIKNEDDEEDGSYLFLVNKNWIMKTKVFIDYYIISIKEMMEKDFLKNAFNEEYVLYSYFNESNDKNGNILYPGPIDNFNLLKYKDAWEDPISDEENYFLKDNLQKNKDYYLISQRNWFILNEIFDSTNEIKKNENKEYFEIKVLILEKRLKKRNFKHLLRRRYIQIRKNCIIQKLKEKIIGCVNYEIKKISKENNEYIDEEDEYEENKKMIKNSIINFYILNKENKNVLIEICSSLTNNILIYNSTLLKEIILSDKESINSLFKIYNKNNHILIIEIGEKNLDNFLQVIKPKINDDKKNNNLIYKCNICEKEININNKYNCGKCNMSFFCSKNCANISGEHVQLHKIMNPLLKPDFNLEILKNRSLYLDEYSRKGIVGLYNLGNTCYLNTVVQCLSNTLDFTKYFALDYYKNEQNFSKYETEGDLVEELSELLKNMWMGTDPVLAPKKLRIAFCKLNYQFIGDNEQDAQEFLSLLLSNLHEKLNRITIKNKLNYNKENKEKENKEKKNIMEEYKRFVKKEKMKNDSIIYDLFNGQFLSSIRCLMCGQKTTTFEQFNILSLPIPKNHFLISIKYFTEKECKNFPFSINEQTTCGNLKDKALEYYKNNIIEKILTNSGGDFNNIYNEDKNKIIYNYNNTKIPKFILYKYIDIFILNKLKMIINNEQMNEEDRILPLYDKNDYEIVLYEKQNISNDYINIYLSATFFNLNNKILFFKKSSIKNFSYPVLFSFDKDMLLGNLTQILKNKFKNILNLENINVEEYAGNPIQIIILHYKKKSPCNFCQKTAEEIPFCLLDNLLEKNYSISILKREFIDSPIILAANSKYFSIKKKFFLNHILFFNPDKEEQIGNENINIYDCLEKFREEEILEKENKYFCDDCQTQQTAKKKIQIFKLPQYLIIQLKRFKYSNGIMAKIFDNTKIETLVEIPDILDLKEFVLGPDKNNSIYELYGSVLHDENNHYTAACKNGERWILYDDDRLFKISYPQYKETYLLFYKKIK